MHPRPKAKGGDWAPFSFVRSVASFPSENSGASGACWALMAGGRCGDVASCGSDTSNTGSAAADAPDSSPPLGCGVPVPSCRGMGMGTSGSQTCPPHRNGPRPRSLTVLPSLGGTRQGAGGGGALRPTPPPAEPCCPHPHHAAPRLPDINAAPKPLAQSLFLGHRGATCGDSTSTCLRTNAAPGPGCLSVP